jgi:hypothetical protein
VCVYGYQLPARKVPWQHSRKVPWLNRIENRAKQKGVMLLEEIYFKFTLPSPRLPAKQWRRKDFLLLYSAIIPILYLLFTLYPTKCECAAKRGKKERGERSAVELEL